MEGSWHTRTTGSVSGDSIIQVEEMEHLNEWNSQPNNNKSSLDFRRHPGKELCMEGSSHTITNEPLPGDSTIQGEIEHLNEGDSQPNNNEPTPVDSYMITEKSVSRLRGLKEKLFHPKTDTKNEKMARYVDLPRVPPSMRGNKAYNECFDPAVVSIGPYHHGKSKSARIEGFKFSSVQRFASFCHSSVDVIYHKLECLTTEAKICYNDSFMANFDDVAFTTMMLLDGCFILDFIQQVMFSAERNMMMTLGDDIPKISSGAWMLMALGNDIPLISRDLFLLENQLPYLILKELMDCDGSLENLVYRYINSEIGLKFGRTRISSSPSAGQNHGMSKLSCILDLFCAVLVGIPCSSSYSGQERSYPPVKELLAMGITFKKNNSICLRDVEFRSHWLSGELLLPQIEINHYTKDWFLNLIAYELSCSDCKNRPFIAFICFLDSLIDHADDVKVLRSEGIICNYLGSDEEVAILVNQLAAGLISETHAYSEVVDKIQSHLQKKRRVHMGEFRHTYFRSPWTTIALIAASYVILLTSIQTFFTVFPR